MTRASWIKLSIFLGVMISAVGLLYACGVRVSDLSPNHLRRTILGFGVWAPVAYLVIYAQPIIPLPASLMTGLAGASFGSVLGTVLAVTGGTLRAAGEFLIARLLGRDVVSRLMRGRLAGLDQHLAEHGFRDVLVIRLIPNLPFDVQNFGFGFSRVRFAPYVLGTFCGLLPGCFALVYLGHSLTDTRKVWRLALGFSLLIATLVLVPSLLRRGTPKRKPTLSPDGHPA